MDRKDKIEEILHFAKAHHFNSVIWSSGKANIESKNKRFKDAEILPLLEADPILLANTSRYLLNLAHLNPLQKFILEREQSEGQQSRIEESLIQNASSLYQASLTKDFEERNAILESPVPRERWPAMNSSLWGPPATLYPPIEAPSGYNPIDWKRDRIIEAAKQYIGTPYRHHHIPSLGIDCSNFSSWVYNYGLGIKFNSHVVRQSEQAGRKLGPLEELKKGDLIYIKGPKKDGTPGKEIRHVALFIDENTIIDSVGAGIKIRPFTGWYKREFAFARRIIE